MDNENNEVKVQTLQRMDEYNLIKYQQLEPVEVVNQKIERIYNILKNQLRDTIDYGLIPGTDKKILFKSGAERIAMNFMIRPSYSRIINQFENYHREYMVKCRLYKMLDIQNFVLVGEGEGSCSTLESKFRYRYVDGNISDTLVPKKYWDLRKSENENDIKEAKKMIPEWAWKPAKDKDGRWYWMEKSDKKIENPDIPDQWNTVLKIANKRAYVAAIVTFCAASNIFISLDDINKLKDEDDINETSYIDIKTPQPSPTNSSDPSWFIKQNVSIKDHHVLRNFLEENTFSFQFFSDDEQSKIYKSFADAIGRLMNAADNIQDLENIAKTFRNIPSLKIYSEQLNTNYNNKMKGLKK